jgi:hypothetical protein
MARLSSSSVSRSCATIAAACFFASASAGELAVGSPALAAAMILRDLEQDAEEPRADRGARLELREPAVHDEEDVLHDVVDHAVRKTEAARVAPHEIEVGLVDLLVGHALAEHDARRRRVLDGVRHRTLDPSRTRKHHRHVDGVLHRLCRFVATTPRHRG